MKRRGHRAGLLDPHRLASERPRGFYVLVVVVGSDEDGGPDAAGGALAGVITGGGVEGGRTCSGTRRLMRGSGSGCALAAARLPGDFTTAGRERVVVLATGVLVRGVPARVRAGRRTGSDRWGKTREPARAWCSLRGVAGRTRPPDAAAATRVGATRGVAAVCVSVAPAAEVPTVAVFAGGRAADGLLPPPSRARIVTTIPISTSAAIAIAAAV
jgi:hypothetical protein